MTTPTLTRAQAEALALLEPEGRFAWRAIVGDRSSGLTVSVARLRRNTLAVLFRRGLVALDRSEEGHITERGRAALAQHREEVEGCPHLHMEERHRQGESPMDLTPYWWCHDCEREVERG